MKSIPGLVIILVMSCFISPVGYSQHTAKRSQIKFKPGLSRFFSTGDNDKFAYRLSAVNNAYSGAGIGGEYSKLVKPGWAWFAGFSYDGLGSLVEINRSNFQSVSGAKGTNASVGFFLLYYGIDKSWNKRESKLRLSLTGGGGIAIVPADGSGSGNNQPDEGVTLGGEQFKSPYNNWFFNQGYFRVVYTENELRIVPVIFLGPRLITKTKKGRDGLGIEVLANYNFTHYSSYVAPYTINGENRKDVFPVKGINLAFNLIVPLINF